MRKRLPVESEYLASVLTELRRKNVDPLLKKRKNLDKDEDLVKRREHLNQCLLLLDETGELESGIRRWVQQWDCVDTLLPELVSLAKIPSTEYRNFCLAVHERLLRLIELDWSADRDKKMLEAAERQLRAAQDAINALSEDQRRSITIAMLGSIPFDGDDWTQQTVKILVGMAKITGSGPYRANEPSKRGPKRERSHVALRELARDLWRIARNHKGDLKVWSADGASAAGTLVEALRLLKPILPRGLVPNVLSVTTLRRALKPDRNCAK